MDIFGKMDINHIDIINKMIEDKNGNPDEIFMLHAMFESMKGLKSDDIDLMQKMRANAEKFQTDFLIQRIINRRLELN